MHVLHNLRLLALLLNHHFRSVVVPQPRTVVLMMSSFQLLVLPTIFAKDSLRSRPR
jgi:hypothetical protein